MYADAQRRIWSEESRRWPGAMSSALHVEPGWKAERKRDELSRADVVRVASAFARRTLEEADVRRPIVVAPYGFPLGRFPARERPRAGPFTVVSVGAHDLREGTPYLLEAWRRAGLKDARLRIVGPLRLSGPFLAGYRGLFEHVPPVARAELGALYRDADLLAFPTLGDGLGLVIEEAMCSGTPVLTTPCGGGPECLDDGVEGWLCLASGTWMPWSSACAGRRRTGTVWRRWGGLRGAVLSGSTSGPRSSRSLKGSIARWPRPRRAPR